MLNKRLQYYSVAIIVLIIVFLVYSVLAMKLPGGYYFLESEKFWHSEIHQKIDCYNANIMGLDTNICDEQIVPSTVVDHVVRNNYILALRVDRDAHFTKEYCKSCQTLTAPCADYWVINWISGEKIGPVKEKEYKSFLSGVNIIPPNLKYDPPESANDFCK